MACGVTTEHDSPTRSDVDFRRTDVSATGTPGGRWDTGAQGTVATVSPAPSGMTWAAALLGGFVGVASLTIAEFGTLPSIAFASALAAASSFAAGRAIRTFDAQQRRLRTAERHALALEPAGGDAAFTWEIEATKDSLHDTEAPVWFSPRWTPLFDVTSGRHQNLDPWLGLVHPEDLGGLVRAIDQLRTGQEVSVRHLFRIGPAQSLRWAELRATRTATHPGVTLAGTVQDVTVARLAHERLTHTAYHDALTGLPNRALLLDRLAHCTARARRNPRYRFGLVYLDIDDFKLTNDSLGHDAGDAILTLVSDRLVRAARPGDTVARIGGDEFCVLLDPVAHGAEAERVARALATAASGGTEGAGQEAGISASTGVALSNADYEDPIDILRDADTAMYHAKQDGAGRVRVFDQVMRASAMRRLWVENELRAGLESAGFWVAFQPIVDLASTDVVGFEALARLRSSTGEAITPAEFIPCAESRGLIDRVLDRVLEDTARQLVAWSELSSNLYVSVNVSARSVNPALVDRVAGVLARYGLRPERIKLELTESLLVGTSSQATSALDALSDAGVGLFIDDFGTGFSSLSYLHQFRVDKIKLDRSFVTALDGQRMPDIVHTIVVLAERLGAGVVAEGIETPTQLAALRALGCRGGQGYLFSAPVPAARATDILLSQTGLQHTPAPVAAVPETGPLRRRESSTR